MNTDISLCQRIGFSFTTEDMEIMARPVPAATQIQIFHWKFGRQMLVCNCLLVSCVGILGRSVTFAGKVNRMEGSSFIAGEESLRLAFAWDRLSSCTLRVPVSS
jgi:hypothetical protein